MNYLPYNWKFVSLDQLHPFPPPQPLWSHLPVPPYPWSASFYICHVVFLFLMISRGWNGNIPIHIILKVVNLLTNIYWVWHISCFLFGWLKKRIDTWLKLKLFRYLKHLFSSIIISYLLRYSLHKIKLIILKMYSSTNLGKWTPCSHHCHQEIEMSIISKSSPVSLNKLILSHTPRLCQPLILLCPYSLPFLEHHMRVCVFFCLL